MALPWDGSTPLGICVLTPRGSLGTVLGMCISPDQLSNEELEENAQLLREYANSYPHLADYYNSRADRYEALLKERAESGEYVNH